MSARPGRPIRHPTLDWRQLSGEDLASLVILASRCLEADGGQPFFADPGFVSACYLSEGLAVGGFDGEVLVCACGVRLTGAGGTGTAKTSAPRVAVTTGMTDPSRRGQGIGGQAFDWALATVGIAVPGAGNLADAGDQAGPLAAGAQGETAAGTLAGADVLRAESEALGDGAHALYLSRGLTQILAEEVMQLPAGGRGPAVPAPAGLRLTEWPSASPGRFFAVYEAAFRERPGFPGRSEAEWVDWITGDDDFMPGWTLLASLDGVDVGFVAGERTGWIAQVGVVPQARGRAVGAHLIAEVIGRMRAAGETSVTLNVGIDNPHAASLYDRLGFQRIGRRARYQRTL